MDKFIIHGGKKLDGTLDISSAKNAYLPILAATILNDKKVILHKRPFFSDIANMCNILESLGFVVRSMGTDVVIDCTNASGHTIPANLAKETRSSIFALGALLGRFKLARVAYPGGCDIGLRPIDLHLKGLRDLNVKISESHGYITCDGSSMRGGVVHLDYPSVGATESIMMAAILAKGRTIIMNAAKEPEIVDLQNFCNSMGARVRGAGSERLEIEGVKELKETEYTPIPDRIIAGTYLIAGAIAGGSIELNNCRHEHISSLCNKLQKSGCKLKTKGDKISLSCSGRLLSSGKIETMPYPGFPTDLQAQFLAWQTICRGNCIIQENLFETRFKHIPELIKMGADIQIKDKTAFIQGVDRLSGAEVYAYDLRGGAALVLAGLGALDYTTVHNIHHIARGYQDMDQALTALGADIKKY